MFFDKQHSLRPQYATIEHIVPVSKGGSNDDNNLALSCRSCNELKRDEHIEPINGGRRHGGTPGQAAH